MRESCGHMWYYLVKLTERSDMLCVSYYDIIDMRSQERGHWSCRLPCSVSFAGPLGTGFTARRAKYFCINHYHNDGTCYKNVILGRLSTELHT
jgi:hypothetical protein